MNVFEQIMSPFIFVIEQILSFSYDLTANYGWSIILLSFAISLLLLPVFIYIEKSKKKDDVVKKKMQPLIDEIKRVYKGQERYYYIKTINRQHNYSSFKALIPILSLLLQIPFFIAAYQFLEHYEPLKEVSFWFIKDLSQPDALFGVVNFLPILMTIVNLITVYFYTINGDGSERKQMLILAGVFLVLLFNLPSALVLYWTMNNVFSFLRLFITNPEVFKNIKTLNFSSTKTDFIGLFPKLKIVFIITFLLLLVSQLYWAFEYNFDDIYIRIGGALVASLILSFIIGLTVIIYKHNKSRFSVIKVQPQVFLSLLFLSIYFYLASKFYFTGENISLSLMAILFLIPTQFLGYLYTIRSSKKTKKIIFKSTKIILFVLFAYQLLLIYSYFSGNEISLNIARIIINIGEASLIDIVGPGIIFSLITIIYYYRLQEANFVQTNKLYWFIFLLSILYVFGLIFFWNPLIVYSSFPENFDFPAFKFLIYNFAPFAISIAISVLLYFIIPKRIKFLIPQIFLSLVVVVLLYSSIIPFDVGTLQINFFSKENNLAAETYYYLFEGILLIAIFIGISKIFKPKFFKQIIYVLIILNLFIITQGLYYSMNTGMFFKNTSAKDYQKDYNQIKEIPFSKDQENIVFFIIDAAQGWFMKDIFNEDPELKELYNGFVWYPNSISTSNFTYASVPAMMCGEDYTIENMNKDESTTILQKVTNSTNHFYDNIKEKGYYFTGNHLKYAVNKPTQIDNYLPKWNRNWSALLNVTLQKSLWFSQLWQNALFSSSPLFLKPRIYNHNKWFESEKDKSENKDINTTELLNKYSFIKILPEISKSDSKESNFIFIHSMFAHAPWDLITEDNKLISDVSPYENQKLFIQLFTNWLQWMKENDVYDNTKIILASDHGRSWWHYKYEINTRDIPIVWTKDKTVNIEQFLRLNPLMLIKDFNAKGKLKEDWRLMSNIDTYAIAFNDNDPTKIDSAYRTVNTYYTEWHTDLHTRKRYYNNLAFKIKNNVYDLHNWESLNATNKSFRSIINSSGKSIYRTPKYDSNLVIQRQTKIISRITHSEKWLNGVKKQAEKREISLDSMLVSTANYVIRGQDKKAREKRAVIIDSIRKDALIMEKVSMQAKSKGISTDSLMVIMANNILRDIKKQ